MDQASIDKAADFLIAIRDSGNRVGRMPDALRPTDVDEANAIQDAVAARRGDTIGGWKVMLTPEGLWFHGNMLKSRCYSSGAEVPSRLMGLLGIEVEIAFRFERALQPRATDYTEAEVAEAASAFVGIEILDRAFIDPKPTTVWERTADSITNGGFVSGTVREDWRALGDDDVTASLIVNGEVKVRKSGDAPGKTPLHRATGLVNVMRKRHGVAVGQIVTCGTYTGADYFKPGDHIRGEFDGFGFVEFTFSK